MAPKEPTRFQLSSRLAYNQTTPAFLARLQRRVAGRTDEDASEYEFEEWQRNSGRPPIPRRPTPPQRPDDNLDSADEDDEDEKPQVVVLKEGKHLTEREAENERRKAKGLPHLPDEPTSKATKDSPRLHEKGQGSSKPTGNQKQSGSASSALSSSVAFGQRSSSKKRKRNAIGDSDMVDSVDRPQESESKKVPKHKKAKKSGALLSFGGGCDD